MFRKIVSLVLVLTLPLFAVNAHSGTKQIAKQTQVKVVSKVNINNAKAMEIAQLLKGVGLRKAEAIVAYRNKNGKFKSIDELAKVKGIGVKTIAQNRARIIL